MDDSELCGDPWVLLFPHTKSLGICQRDHAHIRGKRIDNYMALLGYSAFGHRNSSELEEVILKRVRLFTSIHQPETIIRYVPLAEEK